MPRERWSLLFSADFGEDKAFNPGKPLRVHIVEAIACAQVRKEVDFCLSIFAWNFPVFHTHDICKDFVGVKCDYFIDIKHDF